MFREKEIITLLEKIDTKLSNILALQKAKRIKDATKKRGGVNKNV